MLRDLVRLILFIWVLIALIGTNSPKVVKLLDTSRKHSIKAFDSVEELETLSLCVSGKGNKIEEMEFKRFIKLQN